MKDLSETKKVLGMEVERDAEGIFEVGTSEIQYQRQYEVCKYTIDSHFKVKSYDVSYIY